MPDATTGAGLEAHNVAGAMTTMRLDELISKLAIGIARGQLALDQACMDIARFMSEDHVAFGKRPGTDQRDLMSLIELGFTPNFYQFVDTVLELRVAVSTKFEEKWEQDTSTTRLHSEETEKQSSWGSQQSSSSSGWWSSWGSGGSSSSSQSSQSGGSTSFKTKDVEIATVDAKYASTYNYAVEASSVIKTKIVPVPPPAVFEEIVRAKVRERRDWEHRTRLTEEAKTAFLAQMGAADAMLAKLPAITTVPNAENKDKAIALREAATRLQERHGSLTNEHWALTRSVEDRAAAEGRINAILARANELHAFFSDGGDADPAALEEALKGELTAYKALADSLQKRLTAAGTPAPP